MADIAASLKDWSTTEASNSPSDATTLGAGMADNLQQIQATVRDVYSRDTIASATTTDIGAKDAGSLTVTGTTTITGFGTVSAGIRKWVTFAGALTLTHNSTSLILPTGASITTAAGDTACFESLGSGNWRCLSYTKASGEPIAVQNFALNDLASADGTGTLANGAYAQNWGWSGTSSSTLFTWDYDITAGASPIFFKIDASGSGGTLSGTPIVFQILGASTGQLSYLVDVKNTGYYSSGQFFRINNTGAVSIGGGTNVTGAGGFTGGTDVTITGNSAYTGGGNIAGGSVNISGGVGGGTSAGGSVSIAGEANSGATAYGTVTLTSLSTAAKVFLDYSTGVTVSGSKSFVLDTKHVFVDATNGSPTISSGAGSGPTISGSDHVFQVTVGTGAGTTIVVAFANAYATTPVGVATSSVAGTIVGLSLSTTQATLVFSPGAPASGEKITVAVWGLQ